MANVIVTGATGFIGRNICHFLAKKGHHVRIITRIGSSYNNFPVPLKDVIAVDWPYGLRAEIFEDFDIVVHCANSPEIRDYNKAYIENVLSTRLIGKAIEKKAHLIYISSQSAHEGINSFYAKNKLASEKYIKEEFSGKWTIIRPGFVYGPGAKGLFARMQSLVNTLPIIPF